MNESQKKIARAGYQALATEEERALYRQIVALKGAERRDKVARLIALNAPVSPEVKRLLIGTATMTEEEIAIVLVQEVAQEIRKGLLARLVAFFKGLWK